jgi:DNA-binding MarR family transcriptional regulator
MKASNRQLADRLAELLARMGRQAGTTFLAAMAARDVTLTHVRALDHIGSASEPPTVSALADWLGQSLPTASRLAQGLIARELVSASVDDADRRSRRLTITGDGLALLDEMRAARAADLESFVAGLAPQARERLHDALSHFDLSPTP